MEFLAHFDVGTFFPGRLPWQASWATVPPGVCANFPAVALTVFPCRPFYFFFICPKSPIVFPVNPEELMPPERSVFIFSPKVTMFDGLYRPNRCSDSDRRVLAGKDSPCPVAVRSPVWLQALLVQHSNL